MIFPYGGFCFFRFFFFSSRRRHTRLVGDWSSDVCSSDLSEPHLLRWVANLSKPGGYSKAVENAPVFVHARDLAEARDRKGHRSGGDDGQGQAHGCLLCRVHASLSSPDGERISALEEWWPVCCRSGGGARCSPRGSAQTIGPVVVFLLAGLLEVSGRKPTAVPSSQDLIDPAVRLLFSLRRSCASMWEGLLFPRGSEEHTSELQSPTNLVCR